MSSSNFVQIITTYHPFTDYLDRPKAKVDHKKTQKTVKKFSKILTQLLENRSDCAKKSNDLLSKRVQCFLPNSKGKMIPTTLKVDPFKFVISPSRDKFVLVAIRRFAPNGDVEIPLPTCYLGEKQICQLGETQIECQLAETTIVVDPIDGTLYRAVKDVDYQKAGFVKLGDQFTSEQERRYITFSETPSIEDFYKRMECQKDTRTETTVQENQYPLGL